MSIKTKMSGDVDIRDAFFDEVYRIAAEDQNVIFLTADMGAFSLEKFKRDLKSQYINVGVAEQNLISIAAGLALGGKKVFIYTIASFITERCYEQIKIDLCCMRLPVAIIGVGAGITYNSDGPTHHAIEDIAIMRALPGVTILNPSDPVMSAAVAQLAYKNDGPVYIRIDKGKLPRLYDNNENFSDGLAVLKKGRDLMIITTGIMVHHAFKVATELARRSIDAGIIDMYKLKPINETLLLSLIEEANRIVTLEEHSIIGGIGSAVSEILIDRGKARALKRIAIADTNCAGYGNREWMYAYYGLDIDSIAKAIIEWQQNSNYPDKARLSRQASKPPKHCVYSELTLEDFSELLGTDSSDMPEECRELISKSDFRYVPLPGNERDRIILRVLKTINSDSLMTTGSHRKPVWEKGWAENLQNFLDSNYDLKKLIPKFVKQNEVVRLKGDYVIPTNPDFETCFVQVLRIYLFKKYFSDAATICEFGCGTGLSLVELAKLFPKKSLYGLDWSDNSCNIVNKLAKVYNLNLKGILFDMYSPSHHLDINMVRSSAVFTIGAMEQLGKNFEPFLQFLLKQEPSICINIETIYELYNQDFLFDYIAARFLERREYLQGYLTRLKELEKEGKIKILKVQRTFGDLYHDGYSYIIWKPRNL